MLITDVFRLDENVILPYLTLVSYKWRMLGILLGVSHEELTKLYGEPVARLKVVISLWLSGRCSKPPTLESLISALRNRSVAEDSVATAIEQGKH